MAKIKSPPFFKIDKICEIAGCFDKSKITYEDGFIIVNGIDQADLDIAFSNYDHENECKQFYIDEERGWRNDELLFADIEINKSSDNLIDIEIEFRSYRSALRKWPQSPDFPNKNFRPVRPKQ